MSRALTNVESYDAGVYRRVDDERTDVELQVDGELPAELRGAYVQNSPNPRFPPQGAYHWFDGDGMVHGVSFEDGRATYRNRYIRTAGLAEDEARGAALTRGILEPVDFSRARGPDKNTANTDVVWWNGRLLALWWLGGEPYELDPTSLSTLGRTDLDGTLPCGVAAHPKVDPRTGELVFFDYNPYARPFLRYGVANAEGRVTYSTAIETPRPSLFHDIAVTAKNTVLLDLPMTWDEAKLAQGKRRVRFDRDGASRFGVLPRHGGEVRWFETGACYCYHTVNAWEETDAAGNPVVVMVGCRIEDPIPRVPHDQEPTVPRLYFLRMDPYLHEWRFNLGTGQTTERALDDVPTEFPRMNDRWLGVKSRYAYHPRVAKRPTLLFDGVIKYDLEGGGAEHLEWGHDRTGGEVCFAPRPGATDEDDGWLLTYVQDLREDTTELVVVDARDVSAGPVARVKLPRRVPTGFHAEWCGR